MGGLTGIGAQDTRPQCALHVRRLTLSAQRHTCVLLLCNTCRGPGCPPLSPTVSQALWVGGWAGGWLLHSGRSLGLSPGLPTASSAGAQGAVCELTPVMA